MIASPEKQKVDRKSYKSDTFAVNASRIPTLDGWRAIAILMVLVDHGFGLTGRTRFDVGGSGVTIFFVLSGLLITHRLLTGYTGRDGIQFTPFYLRRGLRILPVVTLYLLVITVLGYGFHLFPVTFPEVIGSLLFSRNYVPLPNTGEGLHGWFTGHFWSLAVEEHYYLLWPIILHTAGKARSKWIAAAGFLIVGTWRTFGMGQGLGFGNILNQVPYFHRTDVRLDGLLLGSLIGIVLVSSASRAALAKYIAKRDTVPLLMLYVWVFLTMYELAGAKEIVLSAALLSLTVLHPEGWLGRLLELRPVRFLGTMSYSLYVWQQLFLVWPEGGMPLYWANAFPLNFVLTFAAAFLSYVLIEKPMIRLGHRLQAVRSERSTASPAWAGHATGEAALSALSQR